MGHVDEIQQACRYLNELLRYVVNEHHYRRYCKIVELGRSERNLHLVERHHICPQSLFPEYAREENNIIKLTPREHFLAHWCLAKATNHRSMWFAFNMMRRVIDDKKKSSLYERARSTIAKLISEANTGREVSDEIRQQVSERFKGKLNVVDAEGNIIHTSVDDPRYLSGELVSIRVGYKHKEETLQKMGKHRLGKKRYYNIHTGIGRYFDPDEEIDDTVWIRGQSDEHRAKNSEGVSKLSWISNPETGECIRLNLEENAIPKGWVKGRIWSGNTGLAKMNSRVKVIDLRQKAYVRVEEQDLSSYHGDDSGKPIDRTLIFAYDGKVFTSPLTLDSYLKTKGIYIDVSQLANINKARNYVVKAPHHNNTPERKEFNTLHQGKTLVDLGIYCELLINHNLDLENYSAVRKS